MPRGTKRRSASTACGHAARDARRSVRRTGGLRSGLLLGALAGLAVDRVAGRHDQRAHLLAKTRKIIRLLDRYGRRAALRLIGRGRGLVHGCLPLTSREPLDDAGLAHKVESVLFRRPDVPKAALSINAEDGTVFLRGQVDEQDVIDALVASTEVIPGVRAVVSLLHLPGTEAPHRTPHGTVSALPSRDLRVSL